MWSMYVGRWNILPKMQYHRLFGSPESYVPNRATKYNSGEAVDISDIRLLQSLYKCRYIGRLSLEG
jgi:hypothetical protein